MISIPVSLTRAQKQRFHALLKKSSQLHPKILPRIQCILAKAEGKSSKEVSATLKVHRNTITNWIKLFNEQGEQGLLSLNYQGREPFLNNKQQEQLEQKLEKELFTRLKDIQNWVEKRFKVRYTTVGLGKLLDRLGYAKKQTGLVPGKADPDKQRAFLKEISKITA